MRPAAPVPRATSLLCVLLLGCVGLGPLNAGAQSALDAPSTAVQSAAQPLPSLEPHQLLERVQSALVRIRRSTPLVGSGPVASGFVIGADQVLTSIAALDATDTPEFLWPSGERVSAPGVLALNRQEGWAILALASPAREPLTRAAAAFKDKDPCFVLGRSPDGRELVARGTVVTGGRSRSLHCVAEFFEARPVPGAPILNAAGDVAGISGTWLPQSAGPLHHVVELAPQRPVGLSTPVIALPTGSVAASPLTFEYLRSRRALVDPVVTGHVSDGGFAHGLEGRDPAVAVDLCDLFSRGDPGPIYVFVRWAPTSPLEGDLVLRMFDERNEIVGESRPSTVKLKRGKKLFQNWRLPVPDRPGEYRLDVSIGPSVYWRSYVTVTDPEASPKPDAAKDTKSPPPRRIGGVLRPPQRLVDVRPMYPRSAQDARVQGVVILTATIDMTGHVTNAMVISSVPALDNAALEAVRRWRFTVTLLEGVPVPVTMTMTTKFSLQ